MSEKTIPELEALNNEVDSVDAAAEAAEVPPQAEQPQQEGGAGEQAQGVNLTTEQEAALLVNTAAWAANVIWPVLKYKEETKAEAVRKLAPLMEKYGVSSELLKRWGLEFEAGIFFGGVIFASVAAVKEAKASSTEGEAEKPKVPWWKRLFSAASVKAA